MTKREKRREIIFGIAFSFMSFGALMVSLTKGQRDMAIASFVFALVAASSWIKLAVKCPKKKNTGRPAPRTADQIAREAELAAQKAAEDAVHQARRQGYREAPDAMQIRQWNKAYLWEWKHLCHPMTRTLYIQTMGKNGLTISHVSGGYRDRCRIYAKDGVWCVSPIVHGVQIRMNHVSARNLCNDMTMNTQEFTVNRGEEQELILGDCFTVIDGSAVGYFRVERLKFL